jgi:hypothetical protein
MKEVKVDSSYLLGETAISDLLLEEALRILDEQAIQLLIDVSYTRST